jgi:hypothetical protein
VHCRIDLRWRLSQEIRQRLTQLSIAKCKAGTDSSSRHDVLAVNEQLSHLSQAPAQKECGYSQQQRPMQ